MDVESDGLKIIGKTTAAASPATIKHPRRNKRHEQHDEQHDDQADLRKSNVLESRLVSVTS